VKARDIQVKLEDDSAGSHGRGLGPALWVTALVVFGVLCTSLAAVRSPHTPDGAGYFGIAYRLLIAGRIEDPVSFIGSPWPMTSVHWPPGYSLALATFLWLGISPTTAARALGFLAGLSAVVGGAMVVGPATKKKAGSALAALWLATCPSLLLGSVSCTSDALFSAIVIAALWVSRVALVHGHAMTLVLLGALAGGAFSVRWVGIVLVALTTLVAWNAGTKSPLPQRLAQLVWFGLGVLPIIIPIEVWRIASGDGPRAAAGPLMFTARSHCVGALATAVTVAPGVFAFLIFGCTLLRPTPQPPLDRREIALHAGWVLGALGLHLVASVRYTIDPISSRVLLPLLPSLVVLLLSALAARTRLTRWRPRMLPVATIMAVFFVVQVAVGARSLFRRDSQQWPEIPRPVASAIAADEHLLSVIPSGSLVLTSVPALASLRPDLHWRRLQRAPNTAAVNLAEALAAHPEHISGFVVWDGAPPLGAPLEHMVCVESVCRAMLAPR